MGEGQTGRGDETQLKSTAGEPPDGGISLGATGGTLPGSAGRSPETEDMDPVADDERDGATNDGTGVSSAP